MYSQDPLILFCVIALCIGLLVGALISRTLVPPKKQRDTKRELEETQQRLEQYQRDVSEHFTDTSKLLNQMAQQYKEVHEHLARGAISLTNPEVSRLVIKAGEGQLDSLSEDKDITEALEHSELDQPRDYAPKKPGEKGTLSEEYGLKSDNDPADLALPLTGPQVNPPPGSKTEV